MEYKHVNGQAYCRYAGTPPVLNSRLATPNGRIGCSARRAYTMRQLHSPAARHWPSIGAKHPSPGLAMVSKLGIFRIHTAGNIP